MQETIPQIIVKRTDELHPYENNPRDNAEAVEFVANSIEEFGFKNPIIIDKNNVIVCGHTRLLAAKKLGIKAVPCIMADDLSEEQVRAFRLADNKVSEVSIWNTPMLDLEMLELKDFFDMSKFGFPAIETEVEDEEKKKTVSSLESMEIKAFEHYDYLVFVFDNQMDWLNVVNMFDIHKVNAGYGKTKKVGVGRVVHGKRLLELLQHQGSDPQPRQK